jgi:hypothetical protein
MTLLAGIFTRGRQQPLPASICEALRRTVSRNTNDEVSVFKDERSYFVKVDIGAYGEAGFHRDADGCLSLLAGEPLLASGDDNDAWQSRTRDLDLLHESWRKDDWSLAARARGVFCAVHYQPRTGTLSLIADKLCIRPLYYWLDDKYVVFATALRIIEGLTEIPKQMDVQAVTEIVGLGVPLGTRTPFVDVSLLRAAEIVQINESAVARKQYWRWDDIKASGKSEPELLQDTYARFSQAVGRRIRQDTTTAAFLSGGLDSRCVVAALRERNIRVHTFNFALPHTQDQMFGAEFARQAETIHQESPMTPGAPVWSKIMADAWNTSTARERLPAERGNLVWSGDGGSVGLGHVYVSPSIVELMRAGKIDAAIDEYLFQEQASIPRRLLQPNVLDALSGSLHLGIRDELDDIRSEDAARSFYLFLMLNDQRRHLANHFEHIDLHRLEFQLPFLDSDFLATVMAIPVDLCLGHKFYTKWLKLFPPFATSVPWQTYPNHEPCPLPIPAELTYQWDRAHPTAQSASRRRALLKHSAGVLNSKDFPERILKRSYLRLASLVHRTGLRDYAYVIEAARTYHKYWTLCGGKYILPPSHHTTAKPNYS